MKILRLQENSAKEVANSPSIHATSSQPRKVRHHICHACKTCHQSKGGKPRWIRAWHVDFTWIHGPTRASKPPQEHVYTEDWLEDPQDNHLDKHTPSGAIGGRPTPQVGWTDLVPATQGLPHGGSWLVPHSIPGCLQLFHTGAQAYK
jgi:hypothetical protein